MEEAANRPVASKKAEPAAPNKAEPSTIVETVENPVVSPTQEKDKKVLDILESVGIQPKIKKRPRFTINN